MKKMRHEKENIERQKSLLETAKQQQDFLDSNKDFLGWVKRDYDALIQMASSVGKLERLIGKEEDLRADLAEASASGGSVKDTQIKLSTIERSKLKLESEMKQVEKLIKRISGAVNAVKSSYNYDEIIEGKAEYVVNKSSVNVSKSHNQNQPLAIASMTMMMGARYNLKLKDKDQIEGTELHNEWAFEVESAAGLIRETVKQFKERAKVDNSINERVIDDFIGDDRSGYSSPAGVMFSKSCFLVKNNDPKQAVYYFTGVDPQVESWGKRLIGLVGGTRKESEYNYDFVDLPVHRGLS